MKKRFETAQQIYVAIDKAKATFNDLLRKAEIQEGLGREEGARQLRIKARNIKDNQLDNLKNKLAEFNTEIMPAILDDRSIPASSRKTKPKPMKG